MCGIFGFNFNDKKLAKSMINSIKHRGPDHFSITEAKNLTLGYVRLSIIDKQNGNQPIYNEDQSSLVYFNGEIYNSELLKHDLEKKGHVFKTDTDTEVIIHAYEEYGIDCLTILNGMFSFVIYDSIKKRIFISRDRIGIKPFYYYFKDNHFLFSSELKSMLIYKEIKREINQESLSEYFTYRYTLAENTIVKDIKKLKPGHYLIYENNEIRIRPYWNLKKKDIKKSNYIKDYYQLHTNSVKIRCQTDLNVGLMISGGIDSSSLLYQLDKFKDNINTYTLGFEDYAHNEFKDAKIVSDHFFTNHKEITINEKALKYLPKVIWHMDEPIADPTSIANYSIAKVASRDTKILFSGEGADESLMGYEQYKLMNLKKIHDKFFMNELTKLSKLITPNEPFFYKLDEFLKTRNPHESYNSLISIFGTKEKQMLLKQKVDSNYILHKIKNFFIYKDLDQSMNNHDLQTFLPDNLLAKVDKTTMAHSIEGRVPFCDHRLIEYSFSLPKKMKLRLGHDKYILRKSMNDCLPKFVTNKKKKRFAIPTDVWFEKGFREYSQNLFEQKKDIVSNFFKRKYLDKLLDKNKMLSHNLLKLHAWTKMYYTRQLWTVTNFIEWYDIFMNDNKPKNNVL
jgi:asparagine synthase (glutamine-hydrolysing)